LRAGVAVAVAVAVAASDEAEKRIPVAFRIKAPPSSGQVAASIVKPGEIHIQLPPLP